MKKPNPFLESPNPPLLAAKRYKGCINYKLLNHRGETLGFTPKNTRGINHYAPKCMLISLGLKVYKIHTLVVWDLLDASTSHYINLLSV